MVLGIDRRLDVVADGAGALAAGCRRPGVRIGQRNLLIGCGFHLPSHLLEGLHLPPQACDLLLEADRLCLGHVVVLTVGLIQGRKIARDARLHLLDALGDFGYREVPIAVVNSFEPPFPR